ncbi:MAG: cache domain-containing protein [Candidatus Omnitrophica bacterium]|nr:cache domain-containing protein [Candidatus Omnitrophota bacterium]
MKIIRLRTQILISLSYVILFLVLCMSIFGLFFVKKYIFDQAQEQIKNDLKTVKAKCFQELNLVKLAVELSDQNQDLERNRNQAQLDYLRIEDLDQASASRSNIVLSALQEKKSVGAYRIISRDEIEQLVPDRKNSFIIVRPTSRAKPTEKMVIDGVIAIEYARPILNSKGEVLKILYGGKIINQNFNLIDNIVDSVFENRFYENKPLGTVTIFQGDVRVATNVLDNEGQRAIGTRVSDEVYRQVITDGKKWFDKAFVVTDWYITAYEPIKDIEGDIIGILYVGILEKPFLVIGRNAFIVFLMIIFLTSILAAIFFYMITRSITRPLNEVLNTTRKISRGNLDSKITEQTSIQELNELIFSFNDMSGKLARREESLHESKEKLEVLNSRYLDLIGFVSHELKGILSSIVLNTYLLKNRILGDINEKQEKTLASVSRNLDYLTVTVKNFLNLSRIEKAELQLTKNELLIKEHVFDVTIESFLQQAEEKNIKIVNDLSEGLRVLGDAGLLQIVSNNLLSNAIKYGVPEGQIRISSRIDGKEIEVEVYNDGNPIESVDIDKLFKKFSRIVYRGMETVKGTGIGLFITKEIIEKHGGRIWVEPKKNGNSFKFRIEKI